MTTSATVSQKKQSSIEKIVYPVVWVLQYLDTAATKWLADGTGAKTFAKVALAIAAGDDSFMAAVSNWPVADFDGQVGFHSGLIKKNPFQICNNTFQSNPGAAVGININTSGVDLKTGPIGGCATKGCSCKVVYDPILDLYFTGITTTELAGDMTGEVFNVKR
jgi:hypothetical protein